MASVLAGYWPGYKQRCGSRLTGAQRAAVHAILACRTSVLGGQVYWCDRCQVTHFAYHPCHHRACPRCGDHKAAQWTQRQQARLLPVPYFLATFTLPEAFRPLFRGHVQELGALLFRESAATLQAVAGDPQYLAVQLGLLGVLHTWTRQLLYHPHVHYLIPGGGRNLATGHWKRVPNPDFLLPVRVLSRQFRQRFRQALQTHHPDWLAQLPGALWEQEWVVHCQPAGSGKAVLGYLSAYLYKTALGRNAILADDGQQVTFRYHDRKSNQDQSLKLDGQEFLRRFLQHVLPKGFQRVRSFGWLAPAAHAKLRQLRLGLRAGTPLVLELKPLPPPVCCRCQQPLRLLGRLPRGPP